MRRSNGAVLLAVAVCMIAGFAYSAEAATVTWWYDVQVTGTRYLPNPATGQIDETPLSYSGLAKIQFDDSMRGGPVVIQTPVLGYTEGTRSGFNFSGETVYAGMDYKTTGTFKSGGIHGEVNVKDISESGAKGHYEFVFKGRRKN